MSTSKEKIGSRIKRVREDLGLTQAKLGEILGVGKSAVSAYESGTNDTSPFILAKLAEISGRSLDWLITGEEEEKEKPPPVVKEAAGEPYGEINPLDAAFLHDWKALSEVEQMRFWTLLKEAIQKDKERHPK